MDYKVRHVLFVCTGNSARSILAEGLMNELGRGRFVGHSAGSHPKDRPHPLALQTLAQFRLPTDGFRSKSWDEFSRPGAPELDFVITVCDQAAGEACPHWPGQPMTAHWGLPDPAAVQGGPEDQQKAFRDAFVALRRRIELMLALPLQSLDAMALQREMQAIGQR
ncbi:MAG: arsenate reductase ArsC [Burkholderiales bacterium]|nr:arsenate reductase ArsC [Burkholderiales bacterium]